MGKSEYLRTRDVLKACLDCIYKKLDKLHARYIKDNKPANLREGQWVRLTLEVTEETAMLTGIKVGTFTITDRFRGWFVHPDTLEVRPVLSQKTYNLELKVIKIEKLT